jgi:transcriptional regulator with XRE-family HTH domain
MNGDDLKQWRERNNYTQERLKIELGVKSRQTVISWEQTDKLPRVLELALIALENYPEVRNSSPSRDKPHSPTFST